MRRRKNTGKVIDIPQGIALTPVYRFEACLGNALLRCHGYTPAKAKEEGPRRNERERTITNNLLANILIDLTDKSRYMHRHYDTMR